MARASEIDYQFKNINFTLNKDQINKCLTLCSQYGIGAEALANKFEAFLVSNVSGEDDLTKSLESFSTRLKLQHSQKTTNNKRSLPQKKKEEKQSGYLAGIMNEYDVNDTYDDTSNYTTMDYDIDDHNITTTTTSPTKVIKIDNNNNNNNNNNNDIASDSSSSRPSSTLSLMEDKDETFLNRLNAKKVELTFNPELETELKIEDREFSFSVDPHTIMKSYRYMNNTVENKAEKLETRLADLAKEIIKFHNIPEEPGNFHLSSPEPVTGVGRIGCEVDASLNEQSIVIESLSEHSKARVRVNLRNMDKFALFSGQVIAFEGINSTGKLLATTSIFNGCPLPFHANENHTSHSPIDVMCASGPFTSFSNLAYRPFETFLGKVETDLPDLVILTGPFIDSQQKCVQEADITYTDIFRQKIALPIRKLISRLESKVDIRIPEFVFIPSTRDIFDTQVLPQAPFSAESFGLDIDHVKILGNPATLKIEKDGKCLATLGVISSDIIRHLLSDEVSKMASSQAQDRLSLMCSHIIQQQCYYPLFPPNAESPIDYTKFEHLSFPGYTPDILLLPSENKYFAKNVNGALCVNAGKLASGLKTFSSLKIFSGEGTVQSKTKVEIIRI